MDMSFERVVFATSAPSRSRMLQPCCMMSVRRESRKSEAKAFPSVFLSYNLKAALCALARASSREDEGLRQLNTMLNSCVPRVTARLHDSFSKNSWLDSKMGCGSLLSLNVEHRKAVNSMTAAKSTPTERLLFVLLLHSRASSRPFSKLITVSSNTCSTISSMNHGRGGRGGTDLIAMIEQAADCLRVV